MSPPPSPVSFIDFKFQKIYLAMSSQLPPPFHRLSASGTVEELRQRLDRNGYITQPAPLSKPL